MPAHGDALRGSTPPSAEGGSSGLLDRSLGRGSAPKNLWLRIFRLRLRPGTMRGRNECGWTRVQTIRSALPNAALRQGF
jgi:hypothetical protein